MKFVRVMLAAAVAAAVLAPISAVQADPSPYMQCVRSVEISCGFPNPPDIDAYHQCVNENIGVCSGLPGDPNG